MVNLSAQDHEIQYLYRISSNYDSMSKSQKKIAKYLMEHKDDMLSSSITALAKKIGTTPSAITRFCQSLNYKGFSELKFYMEKELLSAYSSENRINDSDSLSVIIQKLMRIDQNAISDTLMLLDQEKLSMVTQLTAKANRVHIYGEGATGLSAGVAHAIFMQIGIPCSYYTDPVLMRMATTTLEPGDVAFGITYSGEASNVVDTIRMAAQSGAVTVAITAKQGSTLAMDCDYRLIYSSNIEDELIYLPVARICEIAIVGLLQVCITKSSCQSPEKVDKLRKCIQKIRVNHQRDKNIQKRDSTS